jgi:hypothetical protein
VPVTAFQAGHEGSIPFARSTHSWTPVGVSPVADVKNKDFMLRVIYLIEDTPISHQASAPHAIQRRMQWLPQPLWVTKERSGDEVDGGWRHIGRQLTRDGPSGWRSESYLVGINGPSHVAHRAKRARHPFPG